MKEHTKVSDVGNVVEEWFVRTGGRIGDLGSPFYDEEHQRGVWNEASVVGFQLLLWLLPIAACWPIWCCSALSALAWFERRPKALSAGV